MRGYREQRDYLFNEGQLFDVMRYVESKMIEEIDGFQNNHILNTSTEDLCDYLEDKYRLDPPRLKMDETYIADHGETDIDVSPDPDRCITDRSRPFLIKGTYATFAVPFEGDPGLFKYRPSRGYMSHTYGSIKGTEVCLNYNRTDHNSEAMRADFDKHIKEIQEYLEWIAADATPFNATLRGKAHQRIEWRKEKLLKDQGMAAGLGFPLKKREDAPQTYVAPVVRRKIPIQKPAATGEPYKLEPQLNLAEYEHILGIVSNMVQVMERSPHAFATMGEEDLRQHFLVQLNGQYEGQATGETFNYEGKTDILIRNEGKNLFIAECKIWKGPEVFLKTIDQLLGYTAWRDTKTAIIIFNRNKNFTDVIEKIKETVQTHENFKRVVTTYNSETGIRCIMHQRDDKNREVVLTVLAFDVPT